MHLAKPLDVQSQPRKPEAFSLMSAQPRQTFAVVMNHETPIESWVVDHLIDEIDDRM